jgi:hypothetical protein
LLAKFYRSVHLIAGHRVELIDSEHATGHVYCRAEHEVGGRWVVMAIRYDDEYRKVEGTWLFGRRIERHWYSADQLDHPQAVEFSGWEPAGGPNLPMSSSWREFWDGIDTADLTSTPITSS